MQEVLGMKTTALASNNQAAIRDSHAVSDLEMRNAGAPRQLRVLLVKMSSLGDIVHTFPALTDAIEARPELCFHWLVEAAFVELVACHPAVDDVIPIELRRWRSAPWRQRQQFLDFRRVLQQQKYDLVLDAQGLIKSAVVSRMAHATQRVGLSWRSAREPLASLAYNIDFDIDKDQHAVERTRSLFARALSYPRPESDPRCGLVANESVHMRLSEKTEKWTRPYLVFLHGCSWSSKEWPLKHWQHLARRVIEKGYDVYLPYGNTLEKERAKAIGYGLSGCRVLPEMSLSKLAQTLRRAQAVVTVDSGLGHLAAAWNVPVLGVYQSTDNILTGMLGVHARNMQSQYHCSPCLERNCPIRLDTGTPCGLALTPGDVFERLAGVL